MKPGKRIFRIAMILATLTVGIFAFIIHAALHTWTSPGLWVFTVVCWLGLVNAYISGLMKYEVLGYMNRETGSDVFRYIEREGRKKPPTIL